MEVQLTCDIEDLWYHVRYSSSFTNEIRDWINVNAIGDWAMWGVSGYIGCSLFFQIDEDALAFKLMWVEHD